MRIFFNFRAIIFTLCIILAVSCNTGNPLIPSGSGQNSSVITGSDIPEQSPDLNFTGSVGYMPPRSENPGRYAPDEVLVSLKGEFAVDEFSGDIEKLRHNAVKALENHGLELLEVISDGESAVYRLKILDNTTVPDKLSELRALSVIEYAEPNIIFTFCDVPSGADDPMWENPDDGDSDPRTVAREMWGPSKIGANVVWNDTPGDQSVVVCILDSGVMYDHEDLADVMWINDGEIKDNGLDDDLNGYIDDYFGWDFADNDKDIKEYNGNYSYHGTACAGIVAAARNNQKGCVGVAPGVKIMGCKIGFDYAYLSSILSAVVYARQNGADIISMSFSSTETNMFMQSSMQAAWNSGLVLVAAAANDDNQALHYPAAYNMVICVGGTVPFGPAWNWQPIDEVRISGAGGYGWGSNYGPQLDVMGFGEFYITTHGGGTNYYWDGNNNNYFRGTSGATPFVAGAIALLESVYLDATNEWLRERIQATADDLDVPGFDIQTGWGRANVQRAVYGPDAYTEEEDSNGFVDIGDHENQIIDSIHAVTGDYTDTEDLYKFTADEDGHLNFFLDIWTWGESIDLWLYTDPSLAPQYLIDQSTGKNHAINSFEVVGTVCAVGQTFYLKVTPDGYGDSSTYSIKTEYVEPTLTLSVGTYNPGFIHLGGNDKRIGYMDFTAGLATRITEIILNLKGGMPSDKLKGMSLYKDTYKNGTFDGLDKFVADASIHANRVIFKNLYEELSASTGTQRYFLFADFAGIDTDAFIQFELSSYKDVTTYEGIEIAYDAFPYTIGPFEVGVDIEPPTWDTTEGVQSTSGRYMAAGLQWNKASDVRTPPTKYNVYWTDEPPIVFSTAEHEDNVAFSDGIGFDHKYELKGLENGQVYYVAVRAEDQAGNEDFTTVSLSVVPDDIFDPTWPQIVGSFDTEGDAREVKSDPVGHRLFVADTNGGLVILDTTNPVEPTFINEIDASAVKGVDFDGTYVYAAYGDGLMVVDPNVPEIKSTVPFSDALDLLVVGNWVYVTKNGTALLPVDVTDPLNPVAYPTVTSGDRGYGLWVQDGYLYVATFDKLRIFDLADPSVPVQVGSGFGTWACHDVLTQGDRLYTAIWSGEKTELYNLTDPSAPAYVSKWTSNSGYYGSNVVWFHDYLYFSTQYWGIEVLDVTDLAAAVEVGQVATKGPDGMDTDGIFIYTAENEDGIRIIL